MVSLLRYPTQLPNSVQRSSVAIGNFDGVHIGHQAILERLRCARSQRVRSVVVSFYPHPAVVLRSRSSREKKAEGLLLTGLRQKVHVLSSAGVDYLYLIHFTEEFSQKSATQFCDEIFRGKLRAKHLVLGEDTALGKGRAGDIAYLTGYGEQHGISSEVVGHLEFRGTRIGSGRIRRGVASGEMDEVAAMLGRNYSVTGRVVRGDGRGSQIGFPTANISVGDQMLPKRGVYAVRATVDRGSRFDGVANIGVRPTFVDAPDGRKDQLEVHLFGDRPYELYGKRITVEFCRYLREEQKFSDVHQLKDQIRCDVYTAQKFFSEEREVFL